MDTDYEQLERDLNRALFCQGNCGCELTDRRARIDSLPVFCSLYCARGYFGPNLPDAPRGSGRIMLGRAKDSPQGYLYLEQSKWAGKCRAPILAKDNLND